MPAPAAQILRPDWPAPANVCAASTTRIGGISQPPYDGLNLAAHVGDDPEAVQANRAQLMKILDLPSEPHWLNQSHGKQVMHVTDGMHANPQADAAVTFDSGQVCVVMSADCLPVLFCDRAGTRVAAAHAGWRGLVTGVLEASLDALGIDPAEVLVWLGPAIGPQAFEVGDEVRQQFLAHDPGAALAFSPLITSATQAHWLADLTLLAQQRLQRAGVEAIYGGGLCTFTESQRFFSYRRNGKTGRMATLIWLADG